MPDAQSMGRYASISDLGSKGARWGSLCVARVQNLSEQFCCLPGKPGSGHSLGCVTGLHVFHKPDTAPLALENRHAGLQH